MGRRRNSIRLKLKGADNGQGSLFTDEELIGFGMPPNPDITEESPSSYKLRELHIRTATEIYAEPPHALRSFASGVCVFRCPHPPLSRAYRG